MGRRSYSEFPWYVAAADAAIMPWWMDRLGRAEVVAVSSVDDLPRAAHIEEDILQAQGIGSLVDVPLSFQGKVVGFVGVSSVASRRAWTEDETNLLRIVGQVFANALQRKSAEEALEVIAAAVGDAGYALGKEVFIALDPATSEMYDKDKSQYEFFRSAPESRPRTYAIA